MVRDGMLGGPGDPTDIYSLPRVPCRHADLDKTGFRSDKDNTEIVFNIYYRHH